MASQPTAHAGGKPGWYVVHVRTGQEERMCGVIVRACREHDNAAPNARSQVGLKECFSPRFKAQKKWKGEWRDIERPLLPGYVVADVQNPAMLAQALAGVCELCRVLALEQTYEPLEDHERMWIDEQTGKGERVIPMSFGYKEGDTLVVTRGPLEGHEAMITKIDRSNSLAHVEFHVGPMTIKTTVGLGIVPKGKDTTE